MYAYHLNYSGVLRGFWEAKIEIIVSTMLWLPSAIQYFRACADFWHVDKTVNPRLLRTRTVI